MAFKLGINTGFAVNRYAEHEEWIRIVGDDLNLRYVQFTADMLNPSLPSGILQNAVRHINTHCRNYEVKIVSTFTGAFTRVNHVAHPDPEVAAYWVSWFKTFVDISVDLGAESMGSHFGIMTLKDEHYRSEEIRKRAIENWHRIAVYAKEKGLKYLTWEPMSIRREFGESITAAEDLDRDVNQGAPLPFRLCLDLEHGDVTSGEPDDVDPYQWLKRLGAHAPMLHLKQFAADKKGHFPFTQEHNENGIIQPQKVLDTLSSVGNDSAFLFFEQSFKERNPADFTAVDVLKEGVRYWRSFVRE